jgi:hypothetical protein
LVKCVIKVTAQNEAEAQQKGEQWLCGVMPRNCEVCGMSQTNHRYDVNTRLVVDVWNEPLDQLRQAIGADQEISLVVLYHFAEYLEPVEVIA